MGGMTPVELFLVGLGSGDGDVARSLGDLGVRGRRNDPVGCPIARALEGVFGLRFCVGRSTVACVDVGGGAESLPPGVRRFVAAFDRGRYGELNEDVTGLGLEVA